MHGSRATLYLLARTSYTPDLSEKQKAKKYPDPLLKHELHPNGSISFRPDSETLTPHLKTISVSRRAKPFFIRELSSHADAPLGCASCRLLLSGLIMG
jgi:hypothetical protein